MVISAKARDLLSILGEKEIVCTAFKAVIVPPSGLDTDWRVILTYNPDRVIFLTDSDFRKEWISSGHLTVGGLISLIRWLEQEAKDFGCFREKIVQSVLMKVGFAALEQGNTNLAFREPT